MIYDLMSGALYGDDGSFLKTVYCPMTIRLEDLRQLAPDSPDRKCLSCGDTVHSLDNLLEAEVKQLIEDKPDACVFATRAAKNVVFLHRGPLNPAAPEGQVRIKTARNLEAMSDAQKRGFTLVFKDTGVTNEFGEFKFMLWQNVATGELEWTGDFRGGPIRGSGEWKVIRKFTNVRTDRPFPLAAYLIPEGLPAGSRVFIEDLIQDVPVEFWNQGDANRLLSSSGTWNGEDIEIDEPPEDLMAFQG
ncbi:MAG: hypothetical protein ACK4F4_09380 [Hylemonella sp.]|uniref:hypothetical protein n=1 Tax=Hylemonella sp. TaxID=2066020 RepID=UPI00391D5542